MNIRYRLKYSGGMSTSIYSLDDLENEDMIESMYFLNSNNSIEVISRDLGTDMYDDKGNEAFENDGVILDSGERGIIKWKPGGFFVGSIPLGTKRIKTIIKEV